MKELLVFLAVGVGLTLAIQQCCPDGDILVAKGRCKSNNQTANVDCPNGRWLLKEAYTVGEKLYSLDAPHFPYAETSTKYCLTQVYRNNSNPAAGIVIGAVVCHEDSSPSQMEVTGILTLISVIFLILTLAVYLYLPQMRDLQGLCYISLCISMILGYLSLGVLQLSPGFRGEICTVTGFIVYFWMMATFFWMNVISVNTYRSIDDATHLKKTERLQYFRYSLYAWGGSIFFLIVSLITNFTEGNHWKPGIGEHSCWFQGPTETWIFFYGPIAVLIAVNVVLFMVSSWRLWKETKKYEIEKLNNLKHKFLLSLKLFLVMGISWVFEIASFAHGKSTILWKIMDTFNSLQGVIILLLLVLLRRRAMRGLASEGCCLFITRPLAEKLSPYDDEEKQSVLTDETVEVRLN